MPQAGHIGRPLPLGHRVTVAAEGDVGLAGGQREGEVVHAVGQGAVRLQPGVGEHSQHGRVLAQRLRGEGEQAPAAREGDQVLHQEHADPRLCMSSATVKATSADRDEESPHS